ncbi:MAG: CBS domain-containing protein [Candidatus Binatia bacterium]|nr:CBS domain-containing protein [Candidatus Binatia bacterium]
MAQSVKTGKLATTQVAQWMTKSLITVKPHDTLRQARERMAKYRVNQLPVVMNDKLVGIVTDRDVRDAYPSSLRLLRGRDIDEFGDSHIVEEVMTYNVVSVTPQTSLREAALQLRRQRFGALPVVEDGKLVGIITRSDLLDAMLAEEAEEDVSPPGEERK